MAVKIADTLKALSNTFPVAECVDIDVNIKGTTKRLQKAIDDGEIGGSDSTWTGTKEEWETLSTEEKGKYEVVYFTDDYNSSGIGGIDSSWKGTLEEWEALSPEEKGKYEMVYFTNDYDDSGTGGSDSSWRGTLEEWEALSTEEKGKYEMVYFTDDYDDSGIGGSDSTWKGTREEWDALLPEEKGKYVVVYFTDDYGTGLIDDTNVSNKTTYSSEKIEEEIAKNDAGEAVRTQIDILKDQIDTLNSGFDDIVVKYFVGNYELVDTIVKDNWYENNGTISTYNGTTFGHYEIDVKSGEKYKIKTTCGSNMYAYLILTKEGNVSRKSNSESYGTEHDFDIDLVIDSNESGGKLIVNTLNRSYIAVKKLVGYTMNTDTSNSGLDDMANCFVDNYELVDITIKDNWYANNGTITTYNGTTFGHYEIDIKSGEKYKIKTTCGSNVYAYLILTKEGNISRTSKSESYGTEHDFDIDLVIDSSESDGKLIVNTINRNYIAVKKAEGYAIDVSKIDFTGVSPLYGKKAVFFGDSITAGAGSWAANDTIRAKYNMSGSKNYGVGGSTYGAKQDADNMNCIYNRIRDKFEESKDADYVILQGGVNDAFVGMKMGTVLEDTDFTTECDVTSFAGAFEMTLRFVCTNYPGKKIGFIANCKIPRNRNLGNYISTAKQICQKYSVPVLDLWNESGLNPYIQSINDRYYLIDSDYSTEHSGGTHPTPEGYALYINNKVEKWMESL